MKSFGFAARFGLAVFAASVSASRVVDFSDKTLAPDSFFNGGPATNSDGWVSGGVHFGNDYFADWASWNGFAYSNVNNPTTPGFMNQYAAIPGTAHSGSIYAVAYSGTHAFFNLPSGYAPASVWLTNTTYAYFSMRDGDMFSKKFGGASGNDPDFFEVTFTGRDGADGTGNETGTVTFRLADFTFADNGQDYIVDTWTQVDLSGLGAASSVSLSWDSTDKTSGWVNTPTYVALDSLEIIPEPGTLALLLGAAAGLLVWSRRRRS